MISNRTAFALFRQATNASQSRRPWLKTATHTVSYGELCDRIERIGGLLAAHSVGVGDRVVTALADDVDAAVVIVALICHGVTSVQLDPGARNARAAALIERARPSLVIVDGALRQAWSLDANDDTIVEIPAAAGRSAGLASLLGGRSRSGLEVVIADAARITPPANVPPQTIAYILFTSGTTSQSKGVCISHGALFAHLETLARVYGLESDAQIFNTLMLSHADGIVQGPLLAFAALACVHRPLNQCLAASRWRIKRMKLPTFTICRCGRQLSGAKCRFSVSTGVLQR